MATHRLFSSTAYVPEHEGVLRELLDAASSLDDYLASVRSLGYDVEEEWVGDAPAGTEKA
jgi:hypothetical protein